jgi:hypothetical protein
MSWGYTLDKSITGKQWDAQSPYVRPSEWITLSPITTSEQKCTGVYAVFPDNALNYVAVQCQGAYTVDWGDGVTENVATNVKQTHQYDYAAVGNLTSYGYKQVTITITPQAGQNLTKVDLRVRPDGVGTGVSFPTGWLDIEVGSPNLTTLTIGANNVLAFFPLLQRIRWASKSTSFTNMGDLFYYLQAVQQFVIDANMSNVTSINAMFYGCSALKFGPWMDTGNVTSATFLFGLCGALVNIPAYNFSKVTTVSDMFIGCTKLKQIPLYNTANVTTFNNFALNCYSLEYIPTVNVIKANTLANAFQNCRSLKSIDIVNAGNSNSFFNLLNGCTSLISANVTGNNVNAANINMSGMFNGCNNLTTLTLLDTAKANNMNGMFAFCNDLKTLPNINTSNNFTFTSMFAGCFALEKLPNLDTAKGNQFISMFSQCVSLYEAPNINLSNANSVTSMFLGCNNVKTLPAYNLSNVTSGGGAIISTGAGALNGTPLVNVSFTNLKYTTTFVNCQINKANLEGIFSNALGSVGAAGQVVTITSNPGADTAVNKTSTWTNTSKVITMANTVGLATGYQVTGANIGNAIAVTIQANNTISTTNMIDNNTMVAFANVQTSNLTANTLYYVGNQANVSNTFYYTLATSAGGANLTFTSGTGNLNINRLITAINTNANITISAYPSGNGTSANATTRALNTNIASFKGWTVTG